MDVSQGRRCDSGADELVNVTSLLWLRTRDSEGRLKIYDTGSTIYYMSDAKNEVL
jgi:hypothetical protein